MCKFSLIGSKGMLTLAAGAVLVSQGMVRAADFTWDSTLTGAQSWNVDGNWLGTGVPDIFSDGMPITNADNANIQVGLGANLNIDVGATDTTVQQILIGGTAGAVTTEISSTGGNLILGGTAVLTSGGVAGSVNKISAPVRMDANLSFNATSTRDLAITGNIGQINGARTINNNAGAGVTLTLGTVGSSTIQLYDALVPATGRNLVINTAAGGTTVINGTWDRGATGGTMTLGSGIVNVPTATFKLMADNTAFTGSVQTNKQRYIFGADNAMGKGTITASNNNNANWGTEYQSDNDARQMGGLLILGNSMAFTGNNSITWTGTLTQGNNRAMGNNIAAGKTLTLAGDGTVTVPAIAISRVVGDGTRTWIIEGTGKTVVSGVVVNNFTNDADTTINGIITKRGTGRAELNNALNTYRGQTNANGGMLVFGVAGSWGNTSGITASTNAGITYTPGVTDAGFATFGAKLLSTSSGYYALSAADAGASIDKNAGPLSTAPSIAIAGDGNLTFTGTVTPHATGGYQWGGFNSTLTLGTNASTGAFPVTYKNGGTIALTGTQDYTGVTTVNGANLATAQAGITSQSGGSTTTVNTFYSTVLLVDTLAASGSPSSIGAATNNAGNLVLSGGTLRYVGSTSTSTDHLFTVTNTGGTIEANGAGTMGLGNAGGANVTSGTGARTLTLTGTNTGDNTIGGVLADGTLATDTLAITKTGAGTWRLNGQNTNTGATAVSAGVLKLGAGFKGTATAASAVNVANSAKLEVVASGNAASVTRIKSLNTNTSGLLELHDNDLVLDYTGGSTSYTGTVNQVKAGLTILGGAGTTGIASFDVDNQTVQGTMLAVVDDGDANIAGAITATSGYTLPNPASSVIVKYTWFGDSNLDGIVDGSDYALLDSGFTSGGALGGWVFGDYDYSGVVDGSDYALIDTGFISQNAVLPEPTTLSLLGLGAMGMLRRRRN